MIRISLASSKVCVQTTIMVEMMHSPTLNLPLEPSRLKGIYDVLPVIVVL